MARKFLYVLLSGALIFSTVGFAAPAANAQDTTEPAPETNENAPAAEPELDIPAEPLLEGEAAAAAKKALESEELPQTRAELLDLLYNRLAEAPDAETATALNTAIERVWVTSESATVDLLMARASVLRSSGDTKTAIQILNSVTEIAPDFVEGWNRRAFLHFSDGDYTAALHDLQQTLARDPRHFQAITGLATILRDVGEKDAALKAFRKALEVHPHFENAKAAERELAREVEGQGI